MSIGGVVRKLLGKRAFAIVGRHYRRVFVRSEDVIATLPEIPVNSKILDIGGGDGEFINLILEKLPQANLFMIDIAPSLGSSIRDRYRDRVSLFPSTTLKEFKIRNPEARFDMILISDVLHHIPAQLRSEFFNGLSSVVTESTRLVIKDIEPGSFISGLSLFSDKYISGDRTTQLISKEEIIQSIKGCLPAFTCFETDLYKLNPPNYSLIFTKASTAGR